MISQQPISLSLEELAGEVALTLEHYQLLGNSQDNRVSPVPDARTIRYYTTLGLLDRPVIEGRQARYAKRHLLQAVTIKALQGRGMPLSEIQSRLYGLSDEEMESLLAGMAIVRTAQKHDAPVNAIMWKEIIIDPGLKLMVEDGWSPTVPIEIIQDKLKAAISALIASQRSDGGN
ncbi:MAG TPA: helix-turn-helix domain-containing protein [Candidatus Obscuribacterales bacterium]